MPNVNDTAYANDVADDSEVEETLEPVADSAKIPTDKKDFAR